MNLIINKDSSWFNLLKIVIFLIVISIIYSIFNYIPSEEQVKFFQQPLSQLKVGHFLIIVLYYLILSKTFNK